MREGTIMLEVFKTVNKCLRIIFIGFIAIAALIKVFDIKPKEEATFIDEEDCATSEFDEIW